MSMISIIVPVYKVEQYLPRCIESILAQTYEEFELLLIDDGSPDNCGRICDEYAEIDSRIQVIHQKNQGVSAARNVGVELAKGEWVCFIDSDDYIESNYTSLVLMADDNTDVLFYGCKFINGEDVVEFKSSEERIIKGEVNILAAIHNMTSVKPGWGRFGYPWIKFYKKNILDEYNIRFIENMRREEDTIFSLEYMQHVKQIQLLPNCVYNYIVSSSGLTGLKNSHDEYVLLAHELEKKVSFCKSYPPPAELLCS